MKIQDIKLFGIRKPVTMQGWQRSKPQKKIFSSIFQHLLNIVSGRRDQERFSASVGLEISLPKLSFDGFKFHFGRLLS